MFSRQHGILDEPKFRKVTKYGAQNQSSCTCRRTASRKTASVEFMPLCSQEACIMAKTATTRVLCCLFHPRVIDPVHSATTLVMIHLCQNNNTTRCRLMRKTIRMPTRRVCPFIPPPQNSVYPFISIVGFIARPKSTQ